MISEFPTLNVPESIVRICSLDLKNNKHTFGEIAMIVEADKFLSLLVRQIFQSHIKKVGLSGILSAFGWKGFRDRLAESYIYYSRYQKFPSYVEIDEIQDVLDIERRFDFLFSELNSRVFMLGLYIKLCQVSVEDGDGNHGHDFLYIPTEIDEILVKGSSKSLSPDWLIISVWSLVGICGYKKAQDLLLRSKGSVDLIMSELAEDELDTFISSLLKYGHAIDDTQYFIEKKV